MNFTSFSHASNLCAYCDKTMSTADLNLMSDWLLDLKPSELETFVMLCCKCFEQKFPGYLKLEMPPKEIDAWGRLFEASEAIIWKSAGFDAIQASHWFDLLLEDDGLVDIRVAKEWKQAGFKSEDYEEWREWSKDATEIKDALSVNFATTDSTSAPKLRFRDLGFNLSEAIQLSNAEFGTDLASCEPEDFIDNWMPRSLNVDDLITLKLEVADKREIFQERHRNCRGSIKNWKPDFACHLPNALNNLRQAGLPITCDDLLRYWGLSKEQILKVIDKGIDLEFAIDLVRWGITASKIKVVENLMTRGVEQHSAIALTKKGFSIEVIEKIQKVGYSTDDLLEVVNKMDTLKAEEIAPWLLVNVGHQKLAWLKRITEWHRFGFAAESAAGWYREEFSANDADKWVKSGAKTPAAAKRRMAAGISPNIGGK